MNENILLLSFKEIEHLKNLLGKDIGWHKKYGNQDKEQIAKDIYQKIKKLHENIKQK